MGKGGAQLGKAVKGRSKDKSVKGGNKDRAGDDEALLREKVLRMEKLDHLKRLAADAREDIRQRMKTDTKNAKMNRLKIQNQWRKIMRLAKVEQLRKDIEVLSQSHERDVDRKDAIIQMLDRDLEEAEEQYQMALRAHLDKVDKLIDLQDDRLLGLENDFESELRVLQAEFNLEKDSVVKQHAREKAELLSVMQAVETQETEREAEDKQEHEQLREEIRNKNLEDINVLRITLDSLIEELEQHFETAHLNYLQNTDQRTADFKFLTAKDHDLSKEIELKQRKNDRLQNNISHWKAKISQSIKESQERNRALQEEKDSIYRHFQELKRRMLKFREAQEKQLSLLIQKASKCKDSLKQKEEIGSRILMLAEMARKLESEHEKVMPFYKETNIEMPPDDEQTQDKLEEVVISMGGNSGGGPALRTQAHGADPNTKIEPEEANYLDNFWKKYNKVLLDTLAIKKDQDRLRRENEDLQMILKQYIDGVSVNADVMNSLNPLFVVNGRVNLNQQGAGGFGATPVNKAVVEASHVVQTYNNANRS